MKDPRSVRRFLAFRAARTPPTNANPRSIRRFWRFRLPGPGGPLPRSSKHSALFGPATCRDRRLPRGLGFPPVRLGIATPQELRNASRICGSWRLSGRAASKKSTNAPRIWPCPRRPARPGAATATRFRRPRGGPGSLPRSLTRGISDLRTLESARVPQSGRVKDGKLRSRLRQLPKNRRGARYSRAFQAARDRIRTCSFIH